MRLNRFVAGMLLVLLSCSPGAGSNQEESEILLLGLVYSLLNGGNCAVVSKASTTQYNASIIGASRAACNLNTLIGGDRIAAVTVAQENYARYAALAAGVSGCSAIATSLTTARSQITPTSVCTAGGLNSFGAAAGDCASDAAFSAFVSRLKFVPVDNGAAEARNFLHSQYNATSSASYVDSLTLLPFSGATDPLFVAYYAGSGGNTTCASNVEKAYPVIATFASKMLGIQGYGFGDTSATSTSPTISGASCSYGSGAAASQKCASLNDQY